jgi:methylenetetrahydrofolate dehydrogenase (NADP+)/methenyltetrahydrofolate cyclohydrolase
MPKILDGKIVRDGIMADLKKKIGDFKVVPTLAIIKIGDNPDSDIYVQRKLAFAKKIGVNAYIVDLNIIESGEKREINQEELLLAVEKLNKDESVNGIIIQAPLPPPLNWAEAVGKVLKEKDVDGMHSDFISPTARGVLTLLNYYKIPVKGKKVVVMGRSALVGTPVAELMRRNGADVTVVHSQTENPDKITRQADILIVAIGKPELVGADYVKEGAVVIDVGISTVIKNDGTFNRPRHQNATPSSSDEGVRSKPLATVVGDVDFESVQDLVTAISPVPGGVGPMTVASLFQNLVDSCSPSH